ncbi:unnamed protein product [Closterium sp. Naga37s-1]|nr:unnamed protein product [Closterium sp. Naga37s-1]
MPFIHNASTMPPPCLHHASTMPPPCLHHAFTMPSPPCFHHASTMMACISLANNNLFGRIPDALTLLTNLKTYDLSHNYLTGGLVKPANVLAVLSYNYRTLCLDSQSVLASPLDKAILQPSTVLMAGVKAEAKGMFTSDPVPLFVYENGREDPGCGFELAFSVNFTFALSPKAKAASNGFAFVVSATKTVGSSVDVGFGGMDERSMAIEFDVLQNKPAKPVLNRWLSLCAVLKPGPPQGEGLPEQPRAFYFGFVASTTVKPFMIQTILSSALRTVVSSIEAAYDIAMNVEAPVISVDSLFTAMNLTTQAAKCTAGGSPTEAFEKLTALPKGAITMEGNKDLGCYTGNLNHVVLVIGYLVLRNDGSENRIAPPFWIIRNSWGEAWGDRGHMRMDIQGGDGVCGINVLPGIYPIVKIPGDPCGLKSYKGDGDLQPSMNPCGRFTCTPFPKTNNNTCTCTLPAQTRQPFIEAANGYGSTCVYVNVCGSYFKNPCAVGTCINDGKGSYSCICPLNYVSSTTFDNFPTCDPGAAALHPHLPPSPCFSNGYTPSTFS